MLQGQGSVLHPVTNRPIICERIETKGGAFIDLVDETNEPIKNAAYIVEAVNNYKTLVDHAVTLRSDNARLREALIYCKDHIEANRQDRMGSPAAGCYAAAKASAALANGAE